jgi:MurNAc alpha-1-phosphate uridylyltransferase
MVLAAGLGLRMRPLTLTRPKPLLTVAGCTLLDHALDRLAEAGVETAVVNSHYLGEMIAAHLVGRIRPRILPSPEPSLLETGGGPKAALGHFAGEPFIVVNADILWLDGAVPAVRRLAAAWDPAAMDALLLLMPVARAHGYHGPGDFRLGADGRPIRRGEAASAPLVFAGVHIIRPEAFANTPDGAFSANLVWDRAAAAGRLFGLVHDGEWFHVGTPQDLEATERWFKR